MSEPKPEYAVTKEIQRVIELMDSADMVGNWLTIWKRAHEIGLLAQGVLLDTNVINGEQRLFFNQAERRRLTKL